MTSFAPRGHAPANIYHPGAAKPGALALARGQQALKAGQHDEAIKHFEQSLKEAPGDPAALIGLAQALHAHGRFADSAVYLAQVGELFLAQARQSGKLENLLELTAQMQHFSQFALALRFGEAAVAIDPASFHGHRLLAVTCSQLNRTQEAISAGEKALALAPDHPMMKILLASLEADGGRNASARARLEEVLQHPLGAREEFRARKELARVLDRLREYDSAFAQLKAASARADALPEFASQSKTLVPGMLAENTREFDRALLGKWAGSTFPADQPPITFVLGFMRSGTTLTQEVLDAHADVLVADENNFLWLMQRELHRMNPARISTVAKLRALDLAGIIHLRAFYWSRVRQRYGAALEGKTFVDKHTMGTIDLGLMNVVFPDARVIFVMRDPRDVCVSCFQQLMVPTPSTVHLLHWEGIADFYAQVMDWWMHIRKTMTLPYLELRYEDAVLDFEGSFRRIFEFMGLPWDADVADFHIRAANKFVSTPSRTQVAQPIYTSSVTRWRHFEKQFEPIAARLAPYVTAFNYEPFAPAPAQA